VRQHRKSPIPFVRCARYIVRGLSMILLLHGAAVLNVLAVGPERPQTRGSRLTRVGRRPASAGTRIAAMPRDTLLLDVPGLAIAEVRCRGESTGWSPEEPIDRFAMVLIQRGRFQRRVDGLDRFVDAAVGYVQWPGSVQQIAHPQGGDVCTVLVPAGSMLGDLIDRVGLQETVFTSPGFDLAHRMVVTLARQGADRFEITERAS